MPALGVIAAVGCAWYPPARAPGGLSADCATAAVVGLRWDGAPSSPAWSPARYRISRDGQPLGTVVGTIFVDTTVEPSRSYRYTVAAQAGGGVGPESEPLSVTTQVASADGDAPVCPSRLIGAASWDWSHGYRAAEGSDLWPATWGADGGIYAFFGDGGGFGGDDHRGRTSFGIARIDGPAPPTPETESNVYGGYLGEYPSTLSGKASAIIAVGPDFYSIGGIYRDTDPKGRNPQPISGSPEHVEIAYSPHDAHSWRDGAWDFCEGADVFCPSGFVQFGPGYSGAPDRYVYIFGTWNPALDGGAVHGAGTYLARVDRRRLLSKSAYRYFAGFDARSRPVWSADGGRMRPIFWDRNTSQAGCGGRCPMSSVIEEAVYDAPLERYIGVAQGDYLAQTSFYDAPHPWGPWTRIAYHNIEAVTGNGGWGNLGTAAGGSLGVHPVNAWTSADGKTLWLAFSSDGKAPTGALFPPAGSGLDAFQLLRMDLEVKR
jgi:hypothetical protein